MVLFMLQRLFLTCFVQFFDSPMLRLLAAALFTNAYMALLQGTGLRSFQVAQTPIDMEEDNAMYHAMPPLRLHRVDVSTTALDKGRGREIDGLICHATLCAALSDALA